MIYLEKYQFIKLNEVEVTAAHTFACMGEWRSYTSMNSGSGYSFSHLKKLSMGLKKTFLEICQSVFLGCNPNLKLCLHKSLVPVQECNKCTVKNAWTTQAAQSWHQRSILTTLLSQWYIVSANAPRLLQAAHAALPLRHQKLAKSFIGVITTTTTTASLPVAVDNSYTYLFHWWIGRVLNASFSPLLTLGA